MTAPSQRPPFEMVLDLSGDVSDAPRCRQATRHELARRIDAPLLEDVLLVVSELVANAVRHGLSPLVFRLQVADESLTVSVEDRRAGTDFGVLTIEPRSVRGRGLAIVDHLADRWGVEPTMRGKRVWATFETEALTRVIDQRIGAPRRGVRP